MRALRTPWRKAGPLRRTRLFVARHPLVYWLAVAVAAAVTASFILDRTAAADGARRRWGTDRTVVVATVDLVPGQVVSADDTRTEAWPVALLPDDALRSLPPGAVVAEPIGAGEPLVRRRIGRPGVGPVAALLPAGSRGVHIPVGDTPPRVVPGDRVDLVAGGLTLGTIVAPDALVVAVDERSVVVAVDAAELPAVAGALVNGTVVLAIGGDPPAAP